ncbi:MAG: aldo/keto reductase [Bifidobacterium sp.]|uniref:Aldo/keto reductase n=1 Tax=Bifidobacterium fermentum TaxID=3059035 RepID=A0AB39UC08_9BIFI
MKFLDIGTTGVHASRTALGVMRIADKSQAEANAVVEAALDGGINFFDTADVYADGESSRRFGQSIKDLGVQRTSIVLETKFGIARDDHGHIVGYDFSKKHLLAALDKELDNLQVDYVDFALLHRPDTLVELDDLADAFQTLRNQGKVHHFGVSNVNPGQIDLLQSALDEKLEVNQLQFGLGHTAMVQQEMHVNMDDSASIDHDGGLISYSRLHRMTIQAWSPFQYGFFEGVFLGSPKFPELNAKLDELAAKYQVNASAIAVAWILRHPARMQVLLGSMTPSRLTQMIAGADVELTRQEWYDLYVSAGNDLP